VDHIESLNTKLLKTVKDESCSFYDDYIADPKLNLSILRDYQLYGVEWLLSLHRNGLSGILAGMFSLYSFSCYI
jgi:SNF2 family DNA or RNA helicase